MVQVAETESRLEPESLWLLLPGLSFSQRSVCSDAPRRRVALELPNAASLREIRAQAREEESGANIHLKLSLMSGQFGHVLSQLACSHGIFRTCRLKTGLLKMEVQAACGPRLAPQGRCVMYSGICKGPGKLSIEDRPLCLSV